MAIVTGPLPISLRVLNHKQRLRKDEMRPFPSAGPIQLQPRFAAIKEGLAAGKEAALAASWGRLLRDLSKEVDQVSLLGSGAIPIIDFTNITSSAQAESFSTHLRERGVGIIRNVVCRETALAWSQDAGEYIDRNSHTRSSAPKHLQLHEVYWSTAQVRARANPNLLAAQRFAMSIWKSKDPNARVTSYFPVAYADRLRTWTSITADVTNNAHIDGGSVERWEPDGYGRAGTYEKIFQGRWEEYDPWESSTRLGVTSDLYHKAGACSIFRMFQGLLALDHIPSGGQGSVRACPLPRLATAYVLLRPFFSSSSSNPSEKPSLTDGWSFARPQNSILHGAIPSYAQEISPALHPHLQLDRSLVPVPDLQPGDYLIWHPDLIHAISDGAYDRGGGGGPRQTSPRRNATTKPMYMCLPACPLTQTNALYLSRQRKAFLLGHPGPDFGGGARESDHPDRPGVQEVNDAGGDEGLRAMGLLPWDEEEADTDEERRVLAMANGILFPDLYDMV